MPIHIWNQYFIRTMGNQPPPPLAPLRHNSDPVELPPATAPFFKVYSAMPSYIHCLGFAPLVKVESQTPNTDKNPIQGMWLVGMIWYHDLIGWPSTIANGLTNLKITITNNHVVNVEPSFTTIAVSCNIKPSYVYNHLSQPSWLTITCTCMSNCT